MTGGCTGTDAHALTPSLQSSLSHELTITPPHTSRRAGIFKHMWLAMWICYRQGTTTLVSVSTRRGCVGEGSLYFLERFLQFAILSPSNLRCTEMRCSETILSQGIPSIS